MVRTVVKKVFSKYNSFTKRKPLLSISLSTGVILGLGDCLEQAIQGKPYCYKRTLSMSLYGAVIYGPFCSFWYNDWLPKLAPLTAMPAFKQLGLKIFYDETLQSSFFYVSFLYSMTRLEGGSNQQAVDKVKKDFMRCYLADLAVWPWIQYVNFRYVPPHLQALVVSSITVFWGAYISYVQHSTGHEHEGLNVTQLESTQDQNNRDQTAKIMIAQPATLRA